MRIALKLFIKNSHEKSYEYYFMIIDSYTIKRNAKIIAPESDMILPM